MKSEEFNLKTPRQSEMIDITHHVVGFVQDSGITNGMVSVYCPHTTAGITINENADPDVVHDMLKQLDTMVPWRQPFFDHNEGNSAAHVKSTITGVSETIPLIDGRMILGTWQGIYFCEFDGPRLRKFIVTIVGD